MNLYSTKSQRYKNTGMQSDTVTPEYYRKKYRGREYEAKDIVMAYQGDNYNLGTAITYLLRAGRKMKYLILITLSILASCKTVKTTTDKSKEIEKAVHEEKNVHKIDSVSLHKEVIDITEKEFLENLVIDYDSTDSLIVEFKGVEIIKVIGSGKVTFTKKESLKTAKKQIDKKVKVKVVKKKVAKSVDKSVYSKTETEKESKQVSVANNILLLLGFILTVIAVLYFVGKYIGTKNLSLKGIFK